jgi:hypothetical protein
MGRGGYRSGAARTQRSSLWRGLLFLLWLLGGSAWADLPTFNLEPVTEVAWSGHRLRLTAGTTRAALWSWRKNGFLIEGAYGPTLTLPNVGAATSGRYRAVARNEEGESWSREATITVIADDDSRPGQVDRTVPDAYSAATTEAPVINNVWMPNTSTIIMAGKMPAIPGASVGIQAWDITEPRETHQLGTVAWPKSAGSSAHPWTRTSPRKVSPPFRVPLG